MKLNKDRVYLTYTDGIALSILCQNHYMYDEIADKLSIEARKIAKQIVLPTYDGSKESDAAQSIILWWQECSKAYHRTYKRLV